LKNATQLLARKDPIVWTVTADQSVLDAITLMAEKNIGALCLQACCQNETMLER